MTPRLDKLTRVDMNIYGCTGPLCCQVVRYWGTSTPSGWTGTVEHCSLSYSTNGMSTSSIVVPVCPIFQMTVTLRRHRGIFKWKRCYGKLRIRLSWISHDLLQVPSRPWRGCTCNESHQLLVCLFVCQFPSKKPAQPKEGGGKGGLARSLFRLES